MASGLTIREFGSSIPWPKDTPFSAAVDAEIQLLAQRANQAINQSIICDTLHGPITYRRYRRGKQRCKYCGAKLRKR